MANTLPGNEFADVAHFAAEKVTAGWSNEMDAAVATAYATLALAYEQRTANLIVAAPYLRSMDCPNLAAMCEDQLSTRLGLGGEQA